MAHFAKIENNIVTQVVVVDNSQEHRGQDFLANELGLGGTWIQTSYNAKIRKNYAGIGFTYDEELDAFIQPKPFESWVLDEETSQWKAPIQKPIDRMTKWDEKLLNWVNDVPKPFASWVYDSKGETWVSSIDYPKDGNIYTWNEKSLSWDIAPTE